MPSNDARYSYGGVPSDDAEGGPTTGPFAPSPPGFGGATAAAWVAASAVAHAFLSSTESSAENPSSSVAGSFVRRLGRFLPPLFPRGSDGERGVSLVAASATLVPATLFVAVVLSQAKECLRRKFAKAEAEGLCSECRPSLKISDHSDTTNTRDSVAVNYSTNHPPTVRFRSSAWPTNGVSYRDAVVERNREAAKAKARTISWSGYLTMAEEAAPSAECDPKVVDKSDENFDEEEDPEIQELEENLAPLHLHATRRAGPLRLSGTPTNEPRHGHRSRSSSRGSHRSRSSSPTGGGILPSASSTSVSSAEGGGEVRRASGSGNLAYDGNLSISSIEDVDPDILYDRMGFEELEPPASHPIAGGTLASPGAHLPPVNERLSEETLEDSHAFQDLVPSGTGGGHSSHPSSRGGSVAGGSRTGEDQGLETLDEEEEDSDDDENGDGAGGGGKEGGKKKDLKKKGAKKNTALEHDVLIEMLVDKAGGGVIVEESEEGDKDEAASVPTKSST